MSQYSSVQITKVLDKFSFSISAMLGLLISCFLQFYYWPPTKCQDCGKHGMERKDIAGDVAGFDCALVGREK